MTMRIVAHLKCGENGVELALFDQRGQLLLREVAVSETNRPKSWAREVIQATPYRLAPGGWTTVAPDGAFEDADYYAIAG